MKNLSCKTIVVSLIVFLIAFTPLFAGGKAEKAAIPAATAQVADGESPMLRQLVEAGALPPVEQRLPTDPKVADVYEEIGQYGGTWRNGLVGATLGRMDAVIQRERLFRWDSDYNNVIPNVAKGVEANETATEFTFFLREGMKWSDGEPFTANDIMFWYEDIYRNEELTPALGWGGNPPTVTKLDDYTVKFSFSQPRGFFLQGDIARGNNGWPITGHPRHYFEQFHPKYNPNVATLVQEGGFTGWVELFNSKGGNDGGNDRWQNEELPTLSAWALSSAVIGQRIVYERNPYYWKVDPAGNQLPYVDRVIYDIYEDSEVLVLRALAGEIDHRDNIDGVFGTLDAKAVFFDNQERGDYRFTNLIPTASTELTLWLNMTSKNPVLAEVFSNKDFRIGVSHAIDRQEIIDTVYVGEGIPYQVAPRVDSPYFDEELAFQFTEFNVELANQHLDRAGFSQRDSQGYRLGPDGRRISFGVMVVGDRQPNVDGTELMSQHLTAVGIDLQLRPVDGSLFWTRIGSNDFDALIWSGPGGLGWDVMFDVHGWFPVHQNAWYATGWGIWNVNPNNPNAVEPSDAAKRQIELYNRILNTADTDEQERLMRQILQITKEEFYSIGINLRADNFGIAKNNFRNIPEDILHVTRRPFQYFFDQRR